MDNLAKDREIMTLNKDVQQYEQTVMNLRIELTSNNKPDVSKRDAEVMAGMCCTGAECGDWEPVKDFSEMLRDETLQFKDRIRQMEENVKAILMPQRERLMHRLAELSSSDSVRTMRKVNVSLTEEINAMRRVCAALVEENRTMAVRAQFKDEIIREMRRQLKQAKAKLKDLADTAEMITKDFVSGDGECARGQSAPASYDTVTIACVRAQPRRKRDVPLRDSLAPRDSAPAATVLSGTEREVVVRGRTVSTNAICDSMVCEDLHGFDYGLGLVESGDDCYVNK